MAGHTAPPDSGRECRGDAGAAVGGLDALPMPVRALMTQRRRRTVVAGMARTAAPTAATFSALAGAAVLDRLPGRNSAAADLPRRLPGPRFQSSRNDNK